MNLALSAVVVNLLSLELRCGESGHTSCSESGHTSWCGATPVGVVKLARPVGVVDLAVKFARTRKREIRGRTTYEYKCKVATRFCREHRKCRQISLLGAT